MSILMGLVGWMIMSLYTSNIGVILLLVIMMIFLIAWFPNGGMEVMGSYLGGDMLSFFLVMLSLWICLLVGLSSMLYVNKGLMSYTSIILVCLLMAFFVVHMLMFYVFFELVLIPMFLMILFHGSQPERLESGVYMMFYTILGSMPLLLGLIKWGSVVMTYNYYLLNYYSDLGEKSIGFMVSVGFLVKLPAYGFHLWLPKAHVEAPVEGSMLLAGVLLKLGGYGIFRFMPYWEMGHLLQGVMVGLGLWGGVIAGMVCLRQNDMKKLIAMSSVVHMGLFLASSLVNKPIGLFGGLVMMVGHGLCSSGLFYLVNIIYSRNHSRSLYLASGMLQMTPKLMMWLFLLSVFNMGTPPSMNFLGEISMGMSLIEWFKGSWLLLMLMYFIPVFYMIYFYSVLSQGQSSMKSFCSVTVKEYKVLLLHLMPVLLLTVKLGWLNWV